MKPPQGRLWRWRRRLAARLLVPPAGPWDDDASGEAPPVLLDYPDTGISLRATSMPELRWRARSCAKEPWTVRWIQESIRKGDVLNDIGANVGTFALLAARGSQLRTILIESDADAWDALAGELPGAGFALQSRYDRVGTDDAPSYGLWAR